MTTHRKPNSARGARCAFRSAWALAAALTAGTLALSPTPAAAEETLLQSLPGGDLTSPEGVTNTVQLMLVLGVLSLAPAVLLMTTSFVRIVVVLGLLRQALGNPQAPPTQVITTMALFMTVLIMAPVWHDVYYDALQPYSDPEVEMSLEQAWEAGVRPVRQFMSQQIKRMDNGEDVWLFFRHLPAEQQSQPPRYFSDVPLQVLLPAFLLSELKTAFLIGFRIFLPFLVLDFVIASVTSSMGMTMLPPTVISFPFKIMLFVLVDGWSLVVGTLLDSFGAYL